MGAAANPSSRSAVLGAVKRYWGYDALRPLQEDAIRAGLDGRDSLVVMPTGGGKSLCYQVPPLLTGRMGLVVSPLISLMKDQVDALRLGGYPAAALHSGLGIADSRAVERELDSGGLRLLFVSPERLLTPGFMERVRRLGITSFAIDEAHCISQWGHDFRPEYRRLAELRDRFPDAAIHAYTATATPRVREDIVASLHLRDPRVLIGLFDRPNLTYRIVQRIRRDEQLLEVLARHRDQASIVYCITRKDTEAIAGALTQRGIPAEAYHAGMGHAARRRVQEAFAGERLDVVVATVAFGMGIDRSNVRCILHANMPKSIEAYQQETGRAGRDGLPAECVLLYSAADAMRWAQLMEESAAAAGTQSAAEALEVQMGLLDRMHRYAAGMVCRHRGLCEYFGQEYPAPTCGACDVCLGEMEAVADASVVAQKVLSCIARVGQNFGAAHVIGVLRGSASPRIRERRHDQLSTFGLLREIPRESIASYISQLLDQGVLGRTGGRYPILVLNAASREVLRGTRRVALLNPRRPRERSRAQEAALAGYDEGLFQSLRLLRREIAQGLNVPPYVVFSDATLQDLARVRPTTPGPFLGVMGIGQRKMAEFGERFMAHIARHCAEHGLDTDRPESARPRRPARQSARPTGACLQAREMFERGAGIDEVARAIGRARATVAAYLAEFVEMNHAAVLDPWIDPETQRAVGAAFDRLGDDRLKPVFEHFEGRIPYEDLRLIAARRRSAAGHGAAACSRPHSGQTASPMAG